MQALMLLLWTGALLGHGSCQNNAGGPEEVSGDGRGGGGWGMGGVSYPSPSAAGSMQGRSGAPRLQAFRSRQGKTERKRLALPFREHSGDKNKIQKSEKQKLSKQAQGRPFSENFSHFLA